MTRRRLLSTGTAAMGAAVAGCLGDGTDDRERSTALPVATATLYQGPGCDCCGEYADYLQAHLETDLEVIVRDDLVAVKEEYGIEGPLRSCHTVDLDGYVVEGHVPVDVIETLFDAEPDVDGIALPGMPAGSPGMGGEKEETWQIYQLDDSEPTTVYAEH